MDRIRNCRWGYLVAIVAVAIAVLAHRYSLGGVLDQQFPFLLFFLAVVTAAWIGGLKPGLLALALTVVGSEELEHNRSGSRLKHKSVNKPRSNCESKKNTCAWRLNRLTLERGT